MRIHGAHVLALSAFLLSAAVTGAAQQKPVFDNLELGETNHWQDVVFVPDTTDPEGKKGRWTGWFHQDVVDASKLDDEGIIRAKVEGRWTDYLVVELPEPFLKWNWGHRLEQLAGFKKMMAGEKFTPTISGPHDGIVATHGSRRKDTHFTINNAVKGIGWLPKRENLAEVLGLFKSTWDDPMPKKLGVLESLYQRGAEVFDLTKQTSLELYARPGFETHTFLNQMTDPGVALVFLDLPESYELRCIAQMIHPDDPQASEYEKQVVEYINVVHDYFHGKAPRKAIGVIYHVVQVFDNSPPKGAGRRMVPSQP
ncbi:MAG: hypothetical protein JSU73_09125 [candidate division WOR-3 bacterium]|nr:MAG: hypothetical protein JSU73_09125 [candidate division WOR-3 bacterium]